MTFYTTVPSPLGHLVLASDGRSLTALRMGGRPDRDWVRRDRARPFEAARRQLREYFGGRRRRFALPLDARGTPFQERVWAALRAIPFGETRSYGEVARKIGRPGASRAVGMANRANPVGILVPCHRVIGADGSLTGFGAGLGRKRLLLALERGVG